MRVGERRLEEVLTECLSQNLPNLVRQFGCLPKRSCGRKLRVVTKTATVSLHANTNRVDPALAGRRVELVFSPFDLETIDVRYRDRSSVPPCPTPSAAISIPKPDPTPRRGCPGSRRT